MESNPVAVDGVLYTTNAPLGAVLAIDAATGATIWKYTPSYAGEILNSGAQFTPGSGGRRAGVAVGEGKVFIGLPDGRLVALDQVSGKQVWEAFVGSYKVNAKISTAPIYVNGMVIVGDGSGDGGGASATISAFRAANGGKHLDLERDPVARPARVQDVDERRQGRQRQQPLRRRLVLGVPDRRHEAQHAHRRHRQRRSRGTRAAPARTSTPTRSSRST